jgi:hypothetical protein
LIVILYWLEVLISIWIVRHFVDDGCLV